MNAPMIDVNWIFQTIILKIWASEHVPFKIYWRNKLKKCITTIQNFFIFFNFSPKGKELRPGLWAPSRGWKCAHPKFFDQKSVKLEVSRMLRYGVISQWNLKFLPSVIEIFYIEKFSIMVFKKLHYSIAYISVTEHPGPRKMSMVRP